MGTAGRAAILLDVDGTLNPHREGERARPPEYARHRLRAKFTPGVKTKGLTVWLHPDHGRWLRDLADSGNADLVWATLWEHEANRLLCPIYDWPQLEVITFGGTVFRHRDGHHGKLPAIVEWADRRPICWFDDEFQPGDKDWADARTATVAPTHIIPVDPFTGIQEEHLEQARDFLTRVHH
ncbi:HAD domain-containing protein [Nocardia crassostreae]|uniref:HAD domain-containing protein n=1 Tax=Nocardia crassostreae TaxID=53428 RepID=UPI000831E4B3|nr:HAD domain-containing protein [Nocardia crassostreae]